MNRRPGGCELGFHRTLSIRVALELYRQLEQRARGQGQTLTAFFREMLQREAGRRPDVPKPDSNHDGRQHSL